MNSLFSTMKSAGHSYRASGVKTPVRRIVLFYRHKGVERSLGFFSQFTKKVSYENDEDMG